MNRSPANITRVPTHAHECEALPIPRACVSTFRSGKFLRCRSQIVALSAQISAFFLRCNLHREAGTLVDERLDYIVTSVPRHISACLTVLALTRHKFQITGGSYGFCGCLAAAKTKAERDLPGADRLDGLIGRRVIPGKSFSVLSKASTTMLLGGWPSRA
jgi:hypothetical protein